MEKLKFTKHDSPGGYMYTAGSEGGRGYRYVIYPNTGGNRKAKHRFMLIVKKGGAGEVRFYDYSAVNLRNVAQKFASGSAEIK